MEALATQYWHRIRKLEAELGKTLRKMKKQEEKLLFLERENLELKVENAQLKELLFGKPRKKIQQELPKLYGERGESPPRSALSYRRKTPTEIAEEISYTLEECEKCHGPLTHEKDIICYREDIPFPAKKMVIKEKIGVYRCQPCHQKWYGKKFPLQGSRVILGEKAGKETFGNPQENPAGEGRAHG